MYSRSPTSLICMCNYIDLHDTYVTLACTCLLLGFRFVVFMEHKHGKSRAALAVKTDSAMSDEWCSLDGVVEVNVLV